MRAFGPYPAPMGTGLNEADDCLRQSFVLFGFYCIVGFTILPAAWSFVFSYEP